MSDIEEGEIMESSSECSQLEWDEVGMDIDLDEVMGKLGVVLDEVESHMKEDKSCTSKLNEQEHKKESRLKGRHKRKNTDSTNQDKSSSRNKYRRCSSPTRNEKHIESHSKNTNNHSITCRRARSSSKEEQDEECDRARSVQCFGQAVTSISTNIIQTFFSEAGKVIKVNKSYGAVSLEFAEEESVEKALKLSGKMIEGTCITVKAMQPNSVHAPTDGTRLYLYNINPEKVTEDYLKGIFMKYGTIEAIKVIKDGDTGQSFGFGFIKFSTKMAAKSAWRHEEGTIVEGKPLEIEWLYDYQRKVKPVSVKLGAQRESLEKLIIMKERNLSRSSQVEPSVVNDKLQSTVPSKETPDKKIEVNFLNRAQSKIRSLLSKVHHNALKKTLNTEETAASTTTTTTTTTITPKLPNAIFNYSSSYYSTTSIGKSYFPPLPPSAKAGHFPPPPPPAKAGHFPPPPAAIATHFTPPPPSSVMAAVHSMSSTFSLPSLNPQPLFTAVIPHTDSVMAAFHSMPPTFSLPSLNPPPLSTAVIPHTGNVMGSQRATMSESQPNLNNISWVELCINGKFIDHKLLFDSVPMIAKAKRDQQLVDLYIKTVGQRNKQLCDFVIPLTGGLKWKLSNRRWHVQLVAGADSTPNHPSCQRGNLKFPLLPGIISQAWFIIDGNTTELTNVNQAMSKITQACKEEKLVTVEVSITGSGNLLIDSVVVALTVYSSWEFSKEKSRFQSSVLTDPHQLSRISYVMHYMPVTGTITPIVAGHSPVGSFHKLVKYCSINLFKRRIKKCIKCLCEKEEMERQSLLQVITDINGSVLKKFILPISSSSCRMGVWTLTSDKREWVCLVWLSKEFCLRATTIPRSYPQDERSIGVAQPNLDSLKRATFIISKTEYNIIDVKNTITLLLEKGPGYSVVIQVLPTLEICNPKVTDVVVPITMGRTWNYSITVNMWETQVHLDTSLKILLAGSDKPKLKVNEIEPVYPVKESTQEGDTHKKALMPDTSVIKVEYNHGISSNEDKSNCTTPYQAIPEVQTDPRRMSFKNFMNLREKSGTLEEAMKDFALYSVRLYFEKVQEDFNKVLTQTSCLYVPGHKEGSGLDRLVGQIKVDLDTALPLQDKDNASRRTGDI
ncbi:hypothetical protein Pmani_026164 [Petrolisthes manimaculis]|uniref:RRM domain-containing protein n=1 Tax=Petrolisthes manimaculis TaxID=1843537 RepID=A0AAE1P6M4_9EUCA|nr:hypothetical protein Pmani_026164 [Petrolisthes manimaculis]